MARLRFVTPESLRYDLPVGPDDSGKPDWIEVKKMLTAAEEKRLQGAGVTGLRNPGGGADQTFDLDFERLGLARIEVWVTDWSFEDAKGKQSKVTRENISALDPDTVKDIDAILDRHVEKMAAEKNAPRSAPAGVTN